MANQPEERVLILSFDNSEFEKNTRQSMQTLGELDNKLKNTGSGEPLKALSGSVKNFNMDSMANAIDKVNSRFSNMGVVGSRVLMNLTDSAMSFAKKIITAVPNQIYQGGMKRAQNLERARFQLKGLLGESEKAKEQIQDIMDAASEAVSGTAYGLDSAARIASQLAASGVKEKDRMYEALRGIAGLSAMTGRSYEDMGQIFAKVAGNGRMMTNELNQIAVGGVNAAQTIQKYVNANKDVRKAVIERAAASKAVGKEFQDLSHKTKLSEQQIRRAITGGAISFDLFSKAMSKAFGPAAAKANEEYSGSLDNLKASLSRVGEKTGVAHLRNMTLIFNSLRKAVDNVNKILRPFQLALIKISSALTDMVVKRIDGFTKAIEPLGKNADKYIKQIDKLLDKRKDVLMDYLYKEDEAAEKTVHTWSTLEIAARILGNVFGAIGSVIVGVKNIFVALAQVILTLLTPAFRLVGMVLYTITRVIRNAADRFASFSKSIDLVSESLRRRLSLAAVAAQLKFIKFTASIKESEKAQRLAAASITIFRKALSGLKNAFKTVKGGLLKSLGLDGANKTFSDFAKAIKKGLSSGLETFVKLLERIADSSSIGEVFAVLGKFFEEFGRKVYRTGKKILDSIHPFELLKKVIEKLQGVRNKASSLTGAGEGIKKFGADIKETADKIDRSKITSKIDKIRSAISKKMPIKNVFTEIKKELSGLGDSKVGGGLTAISGKFKDFTSDFKRLDFDSITGNIMTLSKAFAVFAGGKVALNLSKPIGELGKIMKTYRRHLQLKDFRMLAMSVALIAGSIFLLSKVDWKKGWKAALMVSAIFGVLVKVATNVSNGNFDAKKIKDTGFGLAAMASSVLIMAGAAKMLAGMDANGIVKAAVGITAIIGIFFLLKKATSGFTSGVGGSVLAFAASITNLVFAVKLFSMMKPETVLKGCAIITAIVITLGVASRLARSNFDGGMGFIAMATAINLLVPSIGLLGKMNFGKALKAVVILGMVMLELAIASRAAAKAKKGVLIMTGMGVVIASLALSLTLLSSIKDDRLKGAVVALVETMAGLAIAAQFAKGAFTGVVVMAAMMVILIAALKMIQDMKLEPILAEIGKLGSFALQMSAALALLTLVGKFAASAALGVGVLIGTLVVIGVLALGVGALAQKFEGLEPTLKKGIVIANLIGQFIGSFIGGIAEGATDSLPRIAEHLSEFAGKIQPFIAMANTIKDNGAMDGINTLSEMIKNLTITDTLNKFTGGQMDITVFADQIKQFIISYKDIAEEAKEIPEDSLKAVERVAEAGRVFSKLADKVPAIGVWQVFTGYQSLGEFGRDIVAYIEGMRMACSAMVEDTSINEDSLSKLELVAKVGKGFAKLAKSVPEIGIWQVFAGFSSLGNFGVEIKAYVSAMVDAASAVNGDAGANITKKNAERLNRLATVGTAMANVAKGINDSKTTIEKIFGGGELPDFKSFGTAIADYVEGIKPALEKIKDMPESSPEKLEALASVAKKLAQTAQILKEVKAGKNGQGAGIAKFAAEIKDFVDEIKQIEVEGIEDKAKTIKKAAATLAAAKKEMDKASKEAAGDAAKAFTSALSKVKGGSGSASTLQNNVLKGFSTKGFTEAGTKAGNAYVKGVSSAKTDKAKHLASNAADNAKQTSSFESAGKACGQGFANGLAAMKDEVARKGTALGNAAYEAAKAAIKSKSPSKKFRQLGIWSGQGMVLGLESYGSKVYNSGYDLGAEAVKGANDIINHGFNDPVIRPVLDLSGVRNGAQAINGMVLGNGAMVSAGITAKAMSIEAADPIDKLTKKLDILNTTFSENAGETIHIGDVTLDASSLEDVVTVEGFVNMLKQAKAFR